MFSGSRTTMRDNTLLSYAYVTFAEKQVMKYNNQVSRLDKKWLCGDDCDLMFTDNFSATSVYLYLASHWAINPVKQICG